MKRIFSVICLVFISISVLYSQYGRYIESKYVIGFNLQYPGGMTTGDGLTGISQSVKNSVGFGLDIQRKVSRNLNVFVDITAYNCNILMSGQQIWPASATAVTDIALKSSSVEDPGSGAGFDMQATGLRIGAKYIFLRKKFQPWAGSAVGLYDWEVEFSDKDMKQSYGGKKGYVPGITFLAGIDYKVKPRIVLTFFADISSPVVDFSLDEGRTYHGLTTTEFQSHIMGPYRFGAALSFVPKGSKARR